MSRPAWLVYVVGAIAVQITAATVLSDDNLILDPAWYGITSVVQAGIVLWAVRRHRATRPIAWRILAGGYCGARAPSSR